MTSLRAVILRAATLLCVGAVVGPGFTACSLDERPSRSGATAESLEPAPGAVREGARARSSVVPRSNDTFIASEPVEVGWSQCPGVRVWRVDRHTREIPSRPLAPQFFGRDDHGGEHSFEWVLLCELKTQHWVDIGHPEGNNLILWRGPWLFRADQECEWREPVRTERIPGGRRIHLRERCRARSTPDPSARAVSVDVSEDYEHITAH